MRPGRGVGIEAVDPGRCRRQCVCHDVPTIHTPNATTATPASRQAPSGSPNSHAPDSTTSNYMTLLSTAMALQIQRNTVLMQKLTPPDIAINIPMNRFGVFDFDNAERIIRAGYTETLKALDAFERENTSAP